MSENLTPTTTAAEGLRPMPVSVRRALLRYRVMAWIVGVLLLLLTFDVANKYIFHHTGLTIFGIPVALPHGYMYVVYLIVSVDLIRRRRDWKLLQIAAVLIAGTVPFMSFVAEYWVTRKTRSGYQV